MKNMKALSLMLLAVLVLGIFTANAQDEQLPSPPGMDWLAAAAEALDMSPETLMEALSEGQTLAEIAEAQGMEIDALVDALVAAQTEALTERVTEMVHGHGAAFGPMMVGPFHRGQMHIEAMPIGKTQEWLIAASQALEVTDPAVLSTMMAQGKSLADIADENEIEVEAVIEAIESAAFEHIDAAVEAGQLSEERAENLRAYMSNVITEFVLNPSPMPFFQGGMRGMPGEFFQNMPFFENMPRGRGRWSP